MDRWGKQYSLTAMAKKKGVNVQTLRRKAWMAGIRPSNDTGIILITEEEFNRIWAIPGSVAPEKGERDESSN